MARRTRKTVNKPVAPVSARKATADAIKLRVARYYAKKKYGINFELAVSSWGKLRADVFVMTFKGQITIVEVKSCRADFRTDTKWEGYLPFCNQFYFAFDQKTWDSLSSTWEHGPEVGVIVIVDPENPHSALKFARKSRKREVDKDVLLNLVLRAAYRGAKYRSLADIKAGGNQR